MFEAPDSDFLAVALMASTPPASTNCMVGEYAETQRIMRLKSVVAQG